MIVGEWKWRGVTRQEALARDDPHRILRDRALPANGGTAGQLPCDATRQRVNAGSAWINGLEVSYLRHFSGLPGVFGGLELSANYGYTASGASGIAGRSDHPSLLRTSLNVNAIDVVHSGVSGNNGGYHTFPAFLEALPNESSS